MAERAPKQPPNSQEPWTIQRVLVWATEDFARRGIESARLDAELLLARALDTDRLRLILDALRPLDSQELGRYRELIQRRRLGEPIAYILGRREFYGLDFEVDSRVLIPRPDTEALVETALERTGDQGSSGSLLDLCTGSGCVALAFASRRPTWRVTGVDVSEAALAVALRNAERLGTEWDLRFVLGNLMESLDAEERFDVITANAPYIAEADWEALDPGVREFEPRLALAGGQDGLELIRRIVARARNHLKPGGLIALEHAFDQALPVTRLVEQAGFTDIEIRRDYGGNERVVSARSR